MSQKLIDWRKETEKTEEVVGRLNRADQWEKGKETSWDLDGGQTQKANSKCSTEAVQPVNLASPYHNMG